MEINKTRKCHYPGCQAEVLEDSQFDTCQTCRILSIRNATALVTDPFSPRPMDRAPEVTARLLQNMTGEEVIRYQERLEALYLEVCKVVQLYGIKSESKKARKSLEDQIEEAREAIEATSIRAKQIQKREKQKLTRQQKLSKLLGVSEDEAKQFLEEDFGL